MQYTFECAYRKKGRAHKDNPLKKKLKLSCGWKENALVVKLRENVEASGLNKRNITDDVDK